jgi:L-alanine-DL-glutamate epimerase-like enolase superfamily enzyme
MPVAPHNISSPVFGTLLRGDTKFSCTRVFTVQTFRSGMTSSLPKPMIQDGFMRVPDNHGLGVKLNEEITRRYARKGEPFFRMTVRAIRYVTRIC